MTKRSILLAVAALVITAPTAAGKRVPVAGPTPSGARLFVYERDDTLCGSVRSPDQRYRSETCGQGFPRLRAPMIGFDPMGPGRLAFVWGAVAPEVSSVEIVFVDGQRVQAATSEGPGRYAGRLRFFLLETHRRRGVQPLYVRLLSEAGQLLATEEIETGDPSAGPVLVDRGRVGAERWSLRAFRRLRLVPLPGDEERLAEETCVDFGYTGDPACSMARRHTRRCALTRMTFSARGRPWWTPRVGRSACRPSGSPRQTRAGSFALLGDGRRVRVPLRRLPGGFRGRRAFALVLGPRTAVQRLVALDPGGRQVLAEGVAPGTTNCPNTTSSFLLAPDPFGEPRVGPGGPALQIRDDGVLLCATIGLPGRFDCQRPPLDEYESRILWHPTDTGTFAAGVLPRQVAAVVLEWEGGERTQVETTTDGVYLGRYQGLVRFFTASSPGRRMLRGVELLDATGQRMGRVPVFSPPVYDPAPVAVMRASGGRRLGAGVLRPTPTGRRFLCLQITRGAFESEPLGCFGPGPNVAVSCRPRGMQLYGRLREGVRAVRVETSRGDFGARTARLPARLRVPGRVFLVELPARVRPRWVVFERRGSERRRRLRLPPATEQCGYGTVVY